MTLGEMVDGRNPVLMSCSGNVIIWMYDGNELPILDWDGLVKQSDALLHRLNIDSRLFCEVRLSLLPKEVVIGIKRARRKRVPVEYREMSEVFPVTCLGY